ncbi:hypothetical protein GF402_06495 [Candidatus Fermentibacteria bacterium]|nr:hypothetical protein [Candidatus Fermentibacteria bacterium]
MAEILLSVVISFGGFDSGTYIQPVYPPTTSATIGWNTETADSSILAYGTTTALGDTIILPGVANHHHVTMDGLDPGTLYYYRVLPEGVMKTFETFPESVDRADSYAFVAFGDTRSNHSTHEWVIEGICNQEREFYLHSGDLVNDGDNTGDWYNFFQCEDTLAQSTPLVPSIGNHEYPFWPYDSLFSLPGSEEYYSFDYLNSHCVVLNSCSDLYGTQRSWLENDLSQVSSNPQTDWILVCFHHPPYSSGSHGSSISVREAWCPLFEQYDVDVVWNGHDHSYERTIPIKGVVYVVTGGGGAPLYGVGSSSWTAYSRSVNHFCWISIQDRVLTMHAVEPDGSIFDSMVIDKTTAVWETTTPTGVSEIYLNPSPIPATGRVVFDVGLPDRDATADLFIFDASGRLCSEQQCQPGFEKMIWDGKGSSGSQVPAGVYFAVIRQENLKACCTVVLMEE